MKTQSVCLKREHSSITVYTCTIRETNKQKKKSFLKNGCESQKSHLRGHKYPFWRNNDVRNVTALIERLSAIMRKVYKYCDKVTFTRDVSEIYLGFSVYYFDKDVHLSKNHDFWVN